jgi:hypothetical protein
LEPVSEAYFRVLEENVRFCSAEENGATKPVVYTPLVRAEAVSCSRRHFACVFGGVVGLLGRIRLTHVNF